MEFCKQGLSPQASMQGELGLSHSEAVMQMGVGQVEIHSFFKKYFVNIKYVLIYKNKLPIDDINKKFVIGTNNFQINKT